MGYAGVTREDLKEIDGLNDFFSSHNCYTDLDEVHAKMLLNAFIDGRWRLTLNHHALKVHGFESGLKVPLKTKPHQVSSSRKRGSITGSNHWIPAFAGMTKVSSN